MLNSGGTWLSTIDSRYEPGSDSCRITRATPVILMSWASAAMAGASSSKKNARRRGQSVVDDDDIVIPEPIDFDLQQAVFFGRYPVDAHPVRDFLEIR